MSTLIETLKRGVDFILPRTNTKAVTNDNGDNLDDLLDAKYEKPSSGIPKTDLASAVQTSLGKADTALQSFTETDPTVPSWAKQSSKPSYTAGEVGALSADNGMVSDCNAVRAQGKWICDGNTQNAPNGGIPGDVLFVLNWDANTWTQLYFSPSDQQIWRRWSAIGNPSSWQNWEHLPSSANITAMHLSATEQTPGWNGGIYWQYE